MANKLVIEGNIWNYTNAEWGTFEYYLEKPWVNDPSDFAGETPINHAINNFIYENVSFVGKQSQKYYRLTLEELED